MRHAVLRNHSARHSCCALDVVASTGCVIVAEQLFSNAPAHKHSKLGFHFSHRVQHFVFLRNAEGVTKGATSCNNRNFVNGVGQRQAESNKRMTTFVIRDRLFRAFRHDATFTLRTSNDALHRFAYFTLCDNFFTATRRKQRSLVQQVHKVGTRKTRRNGSYRLQINVGA